MAAKVKHTKRFYGSSRIVASFSLDPWIIKRINSHPDAKANRSEFVQNAIAKGMGWKALVKKG